MSKLGDFDSILDRIVSHAKGGEIDKVVENVNLLSHNIPAMISTFTLWINSSFGYIADRLGEEEVYYLWEKILTPRAEKIFALSAMDLLKRQILNQNIVGSKIMEVTEQDDRYILSLDPCGTGGVLRRTGIPNLTKSAEFGMTKKPYDWSWNKRGVPYYCTHCCILGEIIPGKRLGRPLWKQEWPDDPLGMCKFNIFK